MRKLIINADDFGYSQVFNEKILELIETGKIKSTTVMVNWVTLEQQQQFSRLLDFARRNLVSIGLHLEFNDANYEETIKDQLEKFKRITGQMPSHLDMHKSASSPEAHNIVADYAKKIGLPCRNWGQSTEGVIMTKEKVLFATGGFGPTKDFSEVENWLKSLQDGNFYEICFHPGVYDPKCKSSLNKAREIDAENILKLNELLPKYNVELVSFNELKEDRERKREIQRGISTEKLSVK